MRIAVYVWSGLGNLGDDWLVENVVSRLTQLGHEPILLLEPQAVAPGGDQHHLAIRWPSAKRLPFGARNHYAEINRCDALLFAGGGWLASDQGFREPAIWAARLARVSVPVMGVGLGIGPFPGIVGRVAGKLVLRRLSREFPVGVRTQADGEWVASLGVPFFSVGADLAFLSEFEFTRREARSNGKVAISLPPPHVRWTSNPAEWAEKFKERVSERFDVAEVEFISFQQGFRSDGDYWRAYFDNVHYPETPSEAINLMSGFEYAITGRLHATIAASIAGVGRVCTLAYHHKFNLLRDIGLTPRPWSEMRPLDFDAPDHDAIRDLRKSCVQNFDTAIADLATQSRERLM